MEFRTAGSILSFIPRYHPLKIKSGKDFKLLNDTAYFVMHYLKRLRELETTRLSQYLERQVTKSRCVKSGERMVIIY